MTPEQRRFFRDQLRDARAAALLDAEPFHQVVTALEHLGSMLHPRGNGLGQYREVLLPIAQRAESHWNAAGTDATDVAVENLYRRVVGGRNDALHQVPMPDTSSGTAWS